MAKKNSSRAAQPVENIAAVRESELAEAAPAQAEVINEVDGEPIFHADEEAGGGDA